jgi:membrane associated rhomboid family serine protease
MPTRRDYAPPRFSFPRLRGVALTLVLINVAVSFVYLLGHRSGAIGPWLDLLIMQPAAVVHGHVWQLLTYTFIDTSPLSLLFSSLALWTFGAVLENTWGQHRFIELYFGSVIFAGLCAIGVAYTGLLGASPGAPVYSAWGGVMGLLGAYGTAFAEQETFLFLFPQPIKAKWMVLIWIGVALFYFLATGQPLFFAELGGAFFGYLYIKHLPRGFGLNFSERYYGMRNSYYRWKRRRAARKFEVYMRKHNENAGKHFDEYGNYLPPEKRDNGETKGRWVQ